MYHINGIELEDDALGIIDTPDLVKYMSMEIGKTYFKGFGQDNINIEHTDLIYSFNMILMQEGNLSQRIRYNFMMVMGETGGLLSAIFSVLSGFFKFYNYKETHSVVYEEYCRIEKEQRVRDESEI